MLLLTEIAPDLWTVTQPFSFLGLEIGTRMTLVRLPSRDLVIISPIQLSDRDRHVINQLGSVRHIVAPNQFHHLFLESARLLYPEATLWGVPALAEKRADLKFDAFLSQPGSFEAVLEYRQFTGFAAILPTGVHSVQETVFFHRPSGTLILTDTAFNFDETFPFVTRFAARVLGCYQTLRPSRLEKWGTSDTANVESSVRQILTWEFDRVIPGHGSIVESDGKAQLQAGYEWFLGRSLEAKSDYP